MQEQVTRGIERCSMSELLTEEEFWKQLRCFSAGELTPKIGG